MTDWTTCRVVRDRDGDLWFRGCDSDDLWTANTSYPDVSLTTDEVLTVFGTLAPVLDADGLPVVRTVGDLTARHLGKRVQVEGHWDSEIVIGQVLHLEQDADGKPRTDITDQRYDDDQADPFIPFLSDTPCKVLP